MKLADYLRTHSIRGKDFAARIGTSGPSVSRLCAGSQVPSADLARRIYEATDGQVTPNDFHSFIGSSGDPSEAAA